jgi:hypothetical protein
LHREFIGSDIANTAKTKEREKKATNERVRVALVTLVTVQWSHVTFGFRGDGAHNG